MPDTRPDTPFEDGICSACHNFSRRQEVNWESRAASLHSILDQYRSRDQSNWDCIVPVSGGKDSTYQVLRLLELGVNPLCVTATTCDLSEIGRKNIENIKSLGVDYVEFTINPIVRRKLNYIGLTQVGDISWPEHVAIFTIPVRAAIQFQVPLIVWGENGENEYGGPAAVCENSVRRRGWLDEFGGLLGLRVSDMVGLEGLTAKDLVSLRFPSDEQLEERGVTSIYLGYYLAWDGSQNALLAQEHGFTSFPTTVEGSLVNYENLDNHQTGIHDYFKFLKFGFGRATDLACLEIRRGRLTRSDAIPMVLEQDGAFPWTYLGKPIEKVLEPLGIAISEFIKICDRFTNKKLFELDENGNLKKDKKGNLTRRFNP
jgi:N-acetyl sugar amidotransferase